ncbi:helix-turn-helix protein [Oxobacter pfennigii]|uniref:Helix-turn-helix protein n=1 Tax=Oxobacter pfennigii TaxID=36849 RepID=A0A0P8WAZ5_9CLOT|nr:helix-turn-helix transcriptional regulator [Oxobacter pfennigii]KPU45807.1 helix-turn-helix protein [Oxobacter pfennigii]
MRVTPIRLKRINAGINCDEAISMLGISKSMLYKIEIGNRSPSKNVIAKMSELYKCPVDDIFKAIKITRKLDKGVDKV